MRKLQSFPARKRFSFVARLKSFSYAIQGIAFVLRTQHNAWLHLLATAGVVALGLILDITLAEWRWLIVAISAVWVSETLNTAVEQLCDVVSPQYAEAVKRAKDIAAGAVLIASVCAVLLGASVFFPYLAPTF
ncbi:MAG: diacylglycerol kinase family protein [Burkholderiaceae bacterium]